MVALMSVRRDMFQLSPSLQLGQPQARPATWAPDRRQHPCQTTHYSHCEIPYLESKPLSGPSHCRQPEAITTPKVRHSQAPNRSNPANHIRRPRSKYCKPLNKTACPYRILPVPKEFPAQSGAVRGSDQTSLLIESRSECEVMWPRKVNGIFQLPVYLEAHGSFFFFRVSRPGHLQGAHGGAPWRTSAAAGLERRHGHGSKLSHQELDRRWKRRVSIYQGSVLGTDF